MKNKRIISIFLVLGMLCLTACNAPGGKSTEAASETASEAVTEATSEAVTETASETERQQYDGKTPVDTARKNNGHYTFKPYVMSTLMAEIMTPDMNEGYKNLVEAVMKGEKSFKVKDAETYDWIIGQYPYLLFPVLAEYITMPDNGESFKDGVGYFEYTVSDEEFAAKLAEFQDIIEGILNETLDDDYSDVEKALALYLYVVSNYEYDYDTFEKMKESAEGTNVSAYHFFMEKKDVCQGIGAAYSYLLLQAGVDATVMKGYQAEMAMNHQWSYVKINDKYYHIDPTYGMGLNDSLSYFMMTDDKRSIDGYYKEESFPTSVYAQLNGFPETVADDNSFEEIWVTGGIKSWDSEKNEMTYWGMDDTEQIFKYE